SRLPEAGRRREPIGVLGRTTRSVTAGRSGPRHVVSNHRHIRKELGLMDLLTLAPVANASGTCPLPWRSCFERYCVYLLTCREVCNGRRAALFRVRADTWKPIASNPARLTRAAFRGATIRPSQG